MAASTSREQRARLSHGQRFWTEDDGGAEKGMGMIGARQAVRTVGAVCGGPQHGMSWRDVACLRRVWAARLKSFLQFFNFKIVSI